MPASRSRHGLVVALAVFAALASASFAGVRGVPHGTRTYRIVVEGERLAPGVAFVDEAWSSHAPWNRWFFGTSRFDVEHPGVSAGNALVGTAPRARWSFYPQTLDEVVLGRARGDLSIGFSSGGGGVCVPAIGADVARLRAFAGDAPVCVQYPEGASSVEVTIDARPYGSFWLRSLGTPLETAGDRRQLPAGATAQFVIEGGRMAGWSGPLTAIDAAIEGTIIDERDWLRLRGPDRNHHNVLTRADYRAIASAATHDGWVLRLENQVFSVTAPAQTGRRVRLVVIGFAAGDDLALISPLAIESVAAR
jgi:hypothetical protein